VNLTQRIRLMLIGVVGWSASMFIADAGGPMALLAPLHAGMGALVFVGALLPRTAVSFR
jgi:hypothetical protein